jgi:hypothetical protein
MRYDGAAVDLSSRWARNSTVVASPAAAAETIVASITLGDNVSVQEGVYLSCYVAFTAGTNAVSATLKLRATDASGTTLKTSGAVTVVAASLYDRFITGFDASAALPGQVYVATLTMGSGSAPSTVSAVEIQAVAV